MTLKGAIAGIIAGGSTVLIWEQLRGGLFDVYEIVPGFLFASITIIAVSLIDRKPSQIILDEFARVSTGTEKNNAIA